MKLYRIKRFTNKRQLGKYYIQYNKNKMFSRWKNYRISDPSDWYGDNWIGIKEAFDTEDLALKKIASLIKDDIETHTKLDASKKYIKNITSDQIAKILLEIS